MKKNGNSMTLLEKAMSRPSHRIGSREITDQHIELALAWANDKISYAQVLMAITGTSKGTTQVYVVLARSLRQAFRRGIAK